MSDPKEKILNNNLIDSNTTKSDSEGSNGGEPQNIPPNEGDYHSTLPYARHCTVVEATT